MFRRSRDKERGEDDGDGCGCLVMVIIIVIIISMQDGSCNKKKPAPPSGTAAPAPQQTPEFAGSIINPETLQVQLKDGRKKTIEIPQQFRVLRTEEDLRKFADYLRSEMDRLAKEPLQRQSNGSLQHEGG